MRSPVILLLPKPPGNHRFLPSESDFLRSLHIQKQKAIVHSHVGELRTQGEESSDPTGLPLKLQGHEKGADTVGSGSWHLLLIDLGVIGDFLWILLLML